MKGLSTPQPPRLTSSQIASLPTGSGRFGRGCVIWDTTNGLLRCNIGTDAAPAWGKVVAS